MTPKVLTREQPCVTIHTDAELTAEYEQRKEMENAKLVLEWFDLDPQGSRNDRPCS
jgi:hypothetical protein